MHGKDEIIYATQVLFFPPKVSSIKKHDLQRKFKLRENGVQMNERKKRDSIK